MESGTVSDLTYKPRPLTTPQAEESIRRTVSQNVQTFKRPIAHYYGWGGINRWRRVSAGDRHAIAGDKRAAEILRWWQTLLGAAEKTVRQGTEKFTEFKTKISQFYRTKPDK